MAVKLGRGVQFPNGDSVPLVYLSENRVTVQTTDTSTAAVALPTGAHIVTLRASEHCWIRFGGSGVGAAAPGDDSVLFPAGVETVAVPLDSQNPPQPHTHFRVIREGSANGYLQVERLAHVLT